jgi:hypothetical protein
MTGKMKLYIGLLVLGLLLLVSGGWLYYSSPAHKVPAPSGSPAITMRAGRLMAGALSYLAIYEDSTVINVEESGLRPPGAKAVRVWKRGKLRKEEFNSLVQFLKDNANELEETYRFAGIKNPDGSTSSGDLDLTIVINYEGLNKMVRAGLYMSLESGLFYVSYPDMPTPLNEIYERLRDIALTTKEVARETLNT